LREVATRNCGVDGAVIDIVTAKTIYEGDFGEEFVRAVYTYDAITGEHLTRSDYVYDLAPGEGGDGNSRSLDKVYLYDIEGSENPDSDTGILVTETFYAMPVHGDYGEEKIDVVMSYFKNGDPQSKVVYYYEDLNNLASPDISAGESFPESALRRTDQYRYRYNKESGEYALNEDVVFGETYYAGSARRERVEYAYARNAANQYLSRSDYIYDLDPAAEHGGDGSDETLDVVIVYNLRKAQNDPRNDASRLLAFKDFLSHRPELRPGRRADRLYAVV